GDEVRRRQQDWPRIELLNQPEIQRRRNGRRRILHQVKDRVALRTVVENAHAATDHQRLVATQVICEAEARREMDATIVVNALWKTVFARLQHAIGDRTGVRHEPPDKDTGQRVGHGRRETWNEQSRVNRTPVGVAARIRADADRTVKQWRIARAETVGQEVPGLQSFVELRLNPIEPHAVIEGQPTGDFPVILRIPFDVVVAVFANYVGRRLVEGVVDARRRVRKAEAGVEGVLGIVYEVVLAVVVGEAALRLEAVLPECSELQAMRPDNL